MTLAAIRDWLKTLGVARRYYTGRLDRKEPESLGVYDRAGTGRAPVIALGGLDQTRTGVKEVSLLLHWNESPRETEEAAARLFRLLRGAKEFQIDGQRVDYLRLLAPEPVDVGTDEAGICERVIWMDIYYERTAE